MAEQEQEKRNKQARRRAEASAAPPRHAINRTTQSIFYTHTPVRPVCARVWVCASGTARTLGKHLP